MAQEAMVPRTSEAVRSDLRIAGNWLATLCRIYSTHPEIREVADRVRALDTELSVLAGAESEAFIESFRQSVENTRDLVRRYTPPPPAEGDWQLNGGAL